MKDYVQEQLENLKNLTSGILEPKLFESLKKLADMFFTVPEKGSRGNTLLHGDLWSSNLLFRGNARLILQIIDSFIRMRIP
jgi:fructosamine-3-kinase